MNKKRTNSAHNINMQSKNKGGLKKGTKLKRPLYKELYASDFLYRDRPLSENFIKRIGSELIEYVNDPDIEFLRVEPFFMSKGVPLKTYSTWKKEYPLFKQYYDAAWHIIGLRREKGMLTKQLSENAILKTLHYFDPLYSQAKEDEKELLQLKNEAVKVILADPRINLNQSINEDDSSNQEG